MHFEVKLPRRLDVFALRIAGLDTDSYHEQNMAVLLEDAPLPTTVSSPYVLSARPIDVRITVFKYSPDTHLKIEVANAAIGRKIKQTLMRYSAENHGEAVADREHKQLWAKIEKILKRDKLSYDKLQDGAVLTRRALQSLMELCDQTEAHQKDEIHDLASYAAKADRVVAGRWLVNLFETKPKLFADQIGVRLYGIAVPEIGGDLIRVIEDKTHGEPRGDLCLALAKTKHPRAAEVIASVLDEKGITGWALQALGNLKAVQHTEAIRKLLRHADAEIRREAKKALKKMGVPVEAPPPPLHLAKNRRSLPKGLEEWSSNVDLEELKPTLQKLGGFIASGFGEREIAEVEGVVDEMKPDQTKVFRFRISAQGQRGELWLVIFMDDIDSPDLEIHASPKLIQRFAQALQ